MSASSLYYLQTAPVSAVMDAFCTEYAHCEGGGCYSLEAQQRFVEHLVRHPVAVAMPLRSSYVLSVAKKYLQLVEEKAQFSSPSVVTDEGNETLHEDFVEWYADTMSQSSGPTLCKDEQVRSFRHFHLQELPSLLMGSSSCRYAHLCVASQFTNVGLSLWPSAMITVTQLLEELQAPSSHSESSSIFLPRCADGTVRRRGLRIVELGAGVGLTAIALRKLHDHFLRTEEGGGTLPLLERCIMTDYQPNILDNLQANLRLNAHCSGHDEGNEHSPNCVTTKLSREEEEEEGGPIEVHLLDWDEHAQDIHSKWSLWAPHIVLAADCIYDVCVLEGLANTILNALRQAETAIKERSATTEEEGIMVKPVAVIVQTLRQRSTIRQFFEQIGPFVDVECYHVETSSSHENWRPSFTRLPLDGDSMPIVDQRPPLSAASSSHPAVVTPENAWRPQVAKQAGSFVVEMVELICVFRLTLKTQSTPSS